MGARVNRCVTAASARVSLDACPAPFEVLPGAVSIVSDAHGSVFSMAFDKPMS